jgi:hypothetical protein
MLLPAVVLSMAELQKIIAQNARYVSGIFEI